jgi:cation:H+ antiporter
MVFFELAVLLVSLAVLARSSSVVVDNAAKLANFFNISQAAIGFLLVAVATSLPELSVAVLSSASHEGALAAGNVFGSNIANILLVLGLGAFLYGLRIDTKSLKDIGLVLLLTTLISVYIILSSLITGRALGAPEGVVLLGLFLFYVWTTLQNRHAQASEHQLVSKHEALRAFLYFCASIVVVIISSGFVVDSAISLARAAGLAESFIGATLIAVGTSLPELSIDLQAIRKKHYGIALGDAIGSNMVNLTLVLGTAAILNPISVKLLIFIAALLFAVIANMMLFYAAAVRKHIHRLGGAVALGVYAIYLIVIFILQFKELGAT